MKTPVPALTTIVVLALAGCSGTTGTDPTPAPSSADASVSAAPGTPAAPSPTSNPTDGDTLPPSSSSGPPVPLTQCLSGSYRLARFVSLGGSSTYGTGEGGDVRVTFDGGAYTMTGQGKKPIKLTLAGQQAQLGVDGTVRGSLTTAGYQGTFAIQDTSGTATLRAGVQQQELAMADVAKVLAPNGEATLACSTMELIMAFDSIRLELER